MRMLSIEARRLVAGTVAAIAMPVTASVPYQPGSSQIHMIVAECEGEIVNVVFTIRGDRHQIGLNSLSVNGVGLKPTEIAKANALLAGQQLAELEFLGCRRTQQGDVRHWLQLEPSITPANAHDLTRSKWFYVRNGKIEVHERQPVD